MSTITWSPSGCHPGCRDVVSEQALVTVFDAGLPGRDDWYADCDVCGTVFHTGSSRGQALIEALLHILAHINTVATVATPREGTS